MMLTLGFKPISFVTNEDGIVICANDEHPSKTPFSITFTEVGIEISSKE